MGFEKSHKHLGQWWRINIDHFAELLTSECPRSWQLATWSIMSSIWSNLFALFNMIIFPFVWSTHKHYFQLFVVAAKVLVKVCFCSLLLKMITHSILLHTGGKNWLSLSWSHLVTLVISMLKGIIVVVCYKISFITLSNRR